MKRVVKKTATPKTKKKTLLSKAKRSRGVVDAGTIYAIIFLGIVLGAGVLMLGNSSPKLASPDENQPVIIQGGDTSERSNLQLEDFPGITLTPTPSPTLTPTPTPTTPPPATGGGGGGSGSCFVAGTKVLMADKSQKNIEDVKAGDMVMGYDGKKMTKERVTDVESPVRNHHYNVRLEDGTVLGITDDHAVYTQDGWQAISPENAKHESPQLKVSDLKVGDRVLKSNGKYVKVVSMDYFPGDVQTYNLKGVTGYNNYYADGVVAHNKGGGSGSSGGSAL